MGATLRDIGDYTPLGAAVQALQDATAGTWPSAGQLLVMAAYAVICSLLAPRLFRWQ
jgi:ABC-2 type transport system permease protein